jgi:hypothetical protein
LPFEPTLWYHYDMTKYDAVALWSAEVERAGRTFKRLNTQYRREQRRGWATGRTTGLAPWVVGNAASQLEYAVRKAASAALDRLGRDQ